VVGVLMCVGVADGSLLVVVSLLSSSWLLLAIVCVSCDSGA
jgi:hypothetical protein